MSTPADVFEPETILSILTALEKSNPKFEATWRANVKNRLAAWKKCHEKDKNAKVPEFQLQWKSAVVEYTDYLYSKVAVHGNSSASTKATPRPIPDKIPLLGPRFSPPSFLHCLQRSAAPAIKPETAYMLPITVIHPVFYPTMFKGCPMCSSAKIRWDGWNATGGRNIHGVRRDERAIGFQMRCKDCAEIGGSGGYCFVTTNSAFWEKWPHWQIPTSIPYFFRRTAVTHELFDLIIELRPSSTAAGLEEHLKQLHLLEYKQRMLEYLTYFQAAAGRSTLNFNKLKVTKFSEPTDKDGYNDSFITNDLITDMYLDFIARTRQSESISYCQTRTAKSISLDNTFKSASKATIVDKDGRRQNPLKGGILSAINEQGEVLSWRFCLSGSPSEARELLEEVGKRHDSLGVARPLAIIVDNCCQVRQFIIDGLGPETMVLLDVHHFLMRYNAVIFGGVRNPHRGEILNDIHNAIIKTSAQKNVPSTYWTQPEQEARLIEAYDKWLRRGAWSGAVSKVHEDQLKHVRLGCLARPREDISMDGSRIEGSHKAWNSLQRAQPSGIEVYSALAHDFVLRRNIRIASARVESHHSVNYSSFIESLSDSHHIQLFNHTADLFNTLKRKEFSSTRPPNPEQYMYPTLPLVKATEMIGLVQSANSLTFRGHSSAPKFEAPGPELDACSALLRDIDAQVEEVVETRLIDSLEVENWNELISVRKSHRSSKSKAQATSRNAQPAVEVPSTTLTGDIGLAAPDVSCEFSLPPQTSNPPPVSASIAKSHKRKNHAETLAEESEPSSSLLSLPDSKRRRFTGPLSPTMAALVEFPADNITINLDQTPGPQDSVDEMDAIDCQPTDAVETGNIILPNPSSMSSSVHAFFRFQNPATTQRAGDSVTVQRAAQVTQLETPVSQVLQNLGQPLRLPASISALGLTRSQLLFSIGTAIDPRALEIKSKMEFYLFMDMRIEFQWTTFGMVATKWGAVTDIYNTRLEAKGKETATKVFKKNPRALVDKLAAIEHQITTRLVKKDFRAIKSQSEDFWKRHCHGVAAIVLKVENQEADSSTNPAGKSTRSPPICKRCSMIKYSSNKSTNHRRNCCADGVSVTLKPEPQVNEEEIALPHALPPWPQPQHIFTDGKLFNPQQFLLKVHDLYEKVVEQEVGQDATGSTDSNSRHIIGKYTLEEQAFSAMLSARTKSIDGHTYFRLYHDLTFSSQISFESLISTINGRRYLRIDCLGPTN